MQKDANTQKEEFWKDEQVAAGQIDLLGFISVFLGRWPFILALSVAGFLLAAAVAFVLTPQYTSQAVFLPPSQEIPTSENPLSLFLKAPSSATYSRLLLSDSTVNDVIESSKLNNILKPKDADQARAMLRGMTQVSTDTSGFVTLQVTSKDPHLAQIIASNYLAALSRLNDRLAISEAAQHRRVFQTELERAKNDLEAAELALKSAQEQSGVVSPEDQTKAGLSAIDIARSDIRIKQVALAALLQGQTDQSPAVVRARSEIAAEEAQLSRLESSGGAAPGNGLSASQAPSVNLRFVQLEREVKYYQVLFDVTAKQFENAKLQESSSAPAVQVVDLPSLPLHKSRPARTLISAFGAILGGLFACFIVFIKDRFRVLRGDPARRVLLQDFQNHLRRPTFRP